MEHPLLPRPLQAARFPLGWARAGCALVKGPVGFNEGERTDDGLMQELPIGKFKCL